MSVFRGSNTTDADWTVPVQRTPYPARQPEIDEPTQRLHLSDVRLDAADSYAPPLAAAGPRRRARTLVTVLVIAFLELSLAVAASLIAAAAIGRADRAVDRMAPHPAPAPTTVAAHTSATPGESARGSAAEPGLMYAQQPVGLTVPCGSVAYLDVDGEKPRTDGGRADGDLRFDNRCGRDGALFAAGPGARRLSHVSDAYFDRDSCADAVRTDPLPDGDSVLIVPGTTLCVDTDRTIALVEVTGLNQATTDVQVTAWSLTPASAHPSAGGSKRAGRGT